MDSQWGTLIHAKVDYLTKTWKIAENYTFAYAGNGLVGNTDHGGGRWLPRRRNGVLYLARESAPQVLRVDEKNHKVTAIVSSRNGITVPWNADPWGNAPQWLRDWMNNDIHSPIKSYFWMDLNNNGIPQKEEMNLSTANANSGSWHVDDNLNYYTTTGDEFGKNTIYKWAVQSWTKDGIPIYPAWDKGERMADLAATLGGPLLWRLPDGSFFTAANTDNEQKFGVGWWPGRTGGNRVGRIDKTGKMLWAVGRHAPGSVAKPGESKYFWRIVGATHGCIAVGDVENSMSHVWDQDGLWVGRFFDNPDLKVAPAQAYELSGENFGGSLYTNPKTGNVIFYGGGINNTPVYRIRGWDEFERQTGTISLSSAQAAKLSASAKFEEERQDVMRIRSMPNINVDGDLSDWKDAKPIVIMDGNEESAKFWLGTKGDKVVAAWDVNTSTPWKNSATDNFAFQVGASVSFSLGAWDSAPGKEPRPGDTRFVVAPIDGRDKLVWFEPIEVLGSEATTGSPSIVYETGNGKAAFRRIQTTTDTRMSTAVVKQKADGTGYTVEMDMVQWWIPLQIQPHQKYRFDASVQLSNPDGTKTIARIPWHSKDASDMATDDVFYEATLRPQNWGEARME